MSVPISGDVYKRIGRASAGAVSVVTANDPKQDCIVALTVSSFVTLSFDPPLVMFAIQHAADSYAAMVESKAFGVSLLTVHQAYLGARFARKGPDKIQKTSFQSGTKLQVPLIPEALAQLECTTSQVIMSGDHVIIVGLVEEAHTSDGEPLLYFARQFGRFTPLEVQPSA